MYVVHIHLVEFERPFERITQDSITWNWKAQICIIYSWTRGKCFKKGFEKTFKSSQPCRNDLSTKDIQIFFLQSKKKGKSYNQLTKIFFIFSSSNNFIKTIKSSRTNKQNIRCVYVHSVFVSTFSIIFFRTFDYGSFNHF